VKRTRDRSFVGPGVRSDDHVRKESANDPVNGRSVAELRDHLWRQHPHRHGPVKRKTSAMMLKPRIENLR
jgi:hypothetical protein